MLVLYDMHFSLSLMVITTSPLHLYNLFFKHEVSNARSMISVQVPYRYITGLVRLVCTCTETIPEPFFLLFIMVMSEFRRYELVWYCAVCILVEGGTARTLCNYMHDVISYCAIICMLSCLKWDFFFRISFLLLYFFYVSFEITMIDDFVLQVIFV